MHINERILKINKRTPNIIEHIMNINECILIYELYGLMHINECTVNNNE